MSSQELQALQVIAAVDMRDYREEARYIIRQELERRGLLILTPKASQTNQEITEQTRFEVPHNE